MTDKHKKIVFAAAVLLFALSLAYRLMNPYTQKRVERLTFQGAPAVTVDIPGSQDTAAVTAEKNDPLLSRTLHQQRCSGNVVHDLFALAPNREKEESETAEVMAPSFQTEPEVLPLPPKNDPVQRAVEWVSALQLLGRYESREKTAVFFSRNNRVHVVSAGDTMDDNYRIEEIHKDFITIKAIDINETIHLDTRDFNDG